MSKGHKWNQDENEFLIGVLQSYGEKPNDWPDTVRNMVKARLSDRTEGGVYQQVLKMIKSRNSNNVSQVNSTDLQLTKGA
jgi:hypothetical protein